MNKLKLILLDDDNEFLDVFSLLLNETAKVKIVKTLNCPLELESTIATLKPDAIFIDVEMPNYDGITLLKNIRKYMPLLPVVFVSAHDKFAFDAAKLNPFSYLLKPISVNELSRVIEKLNAYKSELNKDNKKTKEKITLPIKDGILYIKPIEIKTLIAEGNYSRIELTSGKIHMSSYNLGRLHDKLPEKHFVKINRSTVVNKEYLKEINRHKKYCILKIGDNEEKYPVSSTFLHNISKIL